MTQVVENAHKGMTIPIWVPSKNLVRLAKIQWKKCSWSKRKRVYWGQVSIHQDSLSEFDKTPFENYKCWKWVSYAYQGLRQASGRLALTVTSCKGRQGCLRIAYAWLQSSNAFMKWCRHNKLVFYFVDVSLLGLVNTCGVVSLDCLWDSTTDEKSQVLRICSMKNCRYFEYAQLELSTISLAHDVGRCNKLVMIQIFHNQGLFHGPSKYYGILNNKDITAWKCALCRFDK